MSQLQKTNSTLLEQNKLLRKAEGGVSNGNGPCRHKVSLGNTIIWHTFNVKRMSVTDAKADTVIAESIN
eukprot:scaffold678850_cov67-Prasinocladus_malaysianus.AAC.1